ncbi:XamI family restriction endonuclease [Conexibacter woesei]|uniref:XamI family restriction endonuclease n=1 Tax=Conexibacter woesei TaxID=191495 RepID=UPI00041D0A09|nr:XamI family restriction endonuclease [Conexibacter woesei]
MDLVRDFKYTEDELKMDIAKATSIFIERVRHAIPAAYRPKLADAREELVQALAVTADLTDLRPEVVAAHPEIVRALRYTAGPPISEEDFRTVTRWPFAARANARAVKAAAPAVCSTVRELADPLLFPWLSQDRSPLPDERKAAINGTAKLLAVERFRTERRGSASKDQEAEVRRVLATDAGLTEVERPLRRKSGHIELIDHLDKGSFTSECVLHGMKCDVPVRLPDGLLMTIECKVNSGQKNGWKRVSREVEGKASRWRDKFGSASVVIAIMLDGNFDLGTLTRFQDEGYFIFWGHDPQRLVDFVNEHAK